MSLSATQDPDTISLESSDPKSILLGCSCHDDNEEVDVVGDDDDNVSTESSSTTPSHAYGEMMEGMDHATKCLLRKKKTFFLILHFYLPGFLALEVVVDRFGCFQEVHSLPLLIFL